MTANATGHPQAKALGVLEALARNNEAGFLKEVAGIGNAKHIDGLHAVLDALVATNKLDSVFNRDVEAKRSSAEVLRQASYREAFTAGLLVQPFLKFCNWSAPQRGLFLRLAPLIAGTTIASAFVDSLSPNIADPAFVETIAQGDLLSLPEAFSIAFRHGNARLAAAISPHISDEQFVLTMKANHITANLGRSAPDSIADGLLKTYLADESGRQATLQLISEYQVRTRDHKALNLRGELLTHYLRWVHGNAELVDMAVIHELADSRQGRLSRSCLPELFVNSSKMQAFSRGLTSAGELAYLAGACHCLPMIRVAWPLLRLTDPLGTAFATRYMADQAGFRSTMRYLGGKLGLSMSSALHSLASISPEPPNEDQKIRLLMNLGANPSIKTADGKFAFEHVSSDAHAARRERWEILTRSHGARQQIEGLIEAISSEPSSMEAFA